MTKKITLKAVLITTMLAASASAGGHTATEQRIIAMKAVGGEMRTLGGMAQGKVAYDDFAALSALETMRNAAAAAQPLFAAPPMEGEETRAMAAIWEDGSDFDAQMNAMLAALDAAIAAEPADLASFTPLFGAVAGTCKACHEKYRAPEE
ncbi:MAG: cytochrome c [Rhodobacteraceae bacterium]|nr:cytochrome c [Paracoccaceae bacterium]